MTPLPRTERLVILGVTESDSHVVANQLIAMQLSMDGFTVVNLGVCTPLFEFAAALIKYPHAEAILIGSLNGHAYADLREIPGLRARGLLGRPIILGGNLSVGSAKEHRMHARLRALGVDHIVENPHELVLLLDVLRQARGVELQRG
jgi:methylaspartate mutase sigma subunit